MKSVSCSLPALIALGVLVTDAQSADPTIAYHDDFGSVEGQLTTNLNGFYEDSSEDKTRYTFTYMSESVKGGDLVMSILEDDETKGPDGKPGVLKLIYDDVPEEATYSGFVYQGRTDDPIRCPKFKGNADIKTLKQVIMSFKYKAANPRKENVGATYNCRLEADVEDSYDHRADFGQLKSTGNWQTFQTTLDKGTNLDKFINAVNAKPEAALKLVWGQEGPVTNYDDNDALLIDDVKIVVSK